MLVVHLFGRLKSFLLGILALIRRALCCFSRRRKRSNSECEILNSISVVQNDGNHSSTASKHRNDPERDWNSWDDSPRTVDEHIEQYRQKLAQPLTPSQEPVVDFFQNMTPNIVKQAKVLIPTTTAENSKQNFSRLQATSAANISVVQTAELEDWTDDENAEPGWDELSDETTKALIREKRRELRQHRQQQQHQQKMKQAQMQSGFAERIGQSAKKH